jgi:GntR family transcriptional repressor for pyruvate dehydrogenase complex
MPSQSTSKSAIGPRRSDAAFRQITAFIHDGRFAPGERLPAERELAELLHVSRPTLRDALNRLEARGYVDRRTGSGNYVCTSIPDAVRTPLEDGVRDKLVTLQQIIDVRKPLEVWAAKEAARQRTQPQIRKLKQAYSKMLAATRAASDADYAQADIQFHLAIAKMTGNAVYLHTIHFLTELILQSLSISRQILDKDFTSANNLNHKAIVDAIDSRQPTEAGKAMAAHFALIESKIRVTP